jgi:hypothetical protein
MDRRLWWDIGKKKIKELAISCSHQLKNELDASIQNVENSIQTEKDVSKLASLTDTLRVLWDKKSIS